jgi:mRNA-degrading endonuclease toxin of MazEF toxin-antitoxin module
VKQMHDVRPQRRWQDLTLRGVSLVRHVEAVPWAELWARVTRALAGAMAAVARRLVWQETA